MCFGVHFIILYNHRKLKYPCTNIRFNFMEVLNIFKLVKILVSVFFSNDTEYLQTKNGT